MSSINDDTIADQSEVIFANEPATPTLLISAPQPIARTRADIRRTLEALLAEGIGVDVRLLQDSNEIVVVVENTGIMAKVRADAAAITIATRIDSGDIGLPIATYESRRAFVHQQIVAAIETDFGHDFEAEQGDEDAGLSDEQVDVLVQSLCASAVVLPDRAIGAIAKGLVKLGTYRHIGAWCRVETEINECVANDPMIGRRTKTAWIADRDRVVKSRISAAKRVGWSDEMLATDRYQTIRRELMDAIVSIYITDDRYRDTTAPPASRPDIARTLWSLYAAERGRGVAATGFAEALERHLPTTDELQRITDLTNSLHGAIPLVSVQSTQFDPTPVFADIDAISDANHDRMLSWLTELGVPVDGGWRVPGGQECLRFRPTPDWTATINVAAKVYENAGEPSSVALFITRNATGRYHMLVSGKARPVGGDSKKEAENPRKITMGEYRSWSHRPSLVMETEPALSSHTKDASTTAWSIAAELELSVIGQRPAVRMVASAIADLHRGRRDGALLLSGPSGCGKTWLAIEAARIAGLPVFIANAAAMSVVGIRGLTVDALVAGLIRACPERDWDIIEQRGALLVLDEADKLCVDDSAARYGQAIIGQLLGLISGTSYVVGDMDDEVFKHPTNKDRKFSRGCALRTDRLLTILCGSWTAQREEADVPGVGFAVGAASGARPVDRLRIEELAGIPTELRGRIARSAAMVPHTAESLMAILAATAGKHLPDHHAKLTADARKALVSEAINRGTGARGLAAALVALRDYMTWADADVRAADRITATTVAAALAAAAG